MWVRGSRAVWYFFMHSASVGMKGCADCDADQKANLQQTRTEAHTTNGQAV